MSKGCVCVFWVSTKVGACVGGWSSLRFRRWMEWVDAVPLGPSKGWPVRGDQFLLSRRAIKKMNEGLLCRSVPSVRCGEELFDLDEKNEKQKK